MALLEIAGLRRSFRGRQVLGPIDLSLDGGERLGLAGPNGSGKSTLLRCVAGTVAPSQGRVAVGGHAAGTLAARALLGVSLAQERSFYLRLTGRQNLLVFAQLRLSRRAAARAVQMVVEELELQDIVERRIDRCSTGMVQQVAFARALLGEPDLLLLDEPTRSLDDGATRRLWDAIRARPRAALVIASHRPEDLGRCEHRLALPVPGPAVG